PLARLRPAPVAELPFISYPRWATPPADVVNPAEGIILGEGWSDLLGWGGDVFRWGRPDAELALNPAGETARTVRLDLEAEANGAECRLEVCDRGRVVAGLPLRAGRQEVRFTVPTEPG